jgi:hypothetical protein
MYCLPAVIYIGLSIIGLLYSILAGLTMGFVIIDVLITFVFAWFLDYLCRNGYPMASWILVLFPFIFMFALLAGVLMTTAVSHGSASPAAP